MSDELSLKEMQQEWHGSIRAYVMGFFGSFLLTATSFALVISRIFSNQTLICLISGLALLQAIVQLLFFLHLGQEAKPKWETVVFIFMVSILLIIVLGSLWIMHDLNMRMMSGMEM